MTFSTRSIERVDVDVYTVDTPGPEADATLGWDATTAVVVHAHARDAVGLGWTYSSAAAAVITELLGPVVTGRELVRRHRCRRGDAPQRPQCRHPRLGHAGPERRGHRPVGPQGQAAR